MNAVRRLRLVERTSPDGRHIRNKLLLAITDSDFAAIHPHLKFLELPLHFAMHEPTKRFGSHTL